MPIALVGLLVLGSQIAQAAGPPEPGVLAATMASTSFTAQATPTTGSDTYGTELYLSAAGLPTAATGTVVFTSGSTDLCSATVSSSSTFCLSPILPVGSYPITATYSGDSNYTGSTATTSFTIVKASISFTVSASPTDPAYGAAILLSAQLQAAPNLSGTITFTLQGSSFPLCSVSLLPSEPVDCFVSSPLDTGPAYVTATYSGNSDYTGSTATNAAVVTVVQAPSSFTASATPSLAAYGSGVRLSATKLPYSASGEVRFLSGSGALLCAATATYGSGSCVTGVLPVGAYSVDASYLGNLNYLGSSATTSFSVTQASSSFTASAAPPTVVQGSAATLTASSLPAGATGLVTFSSGSTDLCSATITSGLAVCLTPALAVGAYPVTASYPGDANYTGSSATTSFSVKWSTSITASATPASVTSGSGVRLSAAGLPADATGSVTFTSGSTALCAAAVSSGTASCTTAATTLGGHAVTATYSGDATHLGSSATTSFTVTAAQTSTRIAATASPSSVARGSAVTLAASGLPEDATGTVTFTSGSTDLCAAPVSLGYASCTTAFLVSGSYSIVATYSGDGDHLGSSAVTSLIVTPDPLLTLSAAGTPAAVSAGSTYTLRLSAVLASAGGPAYNDPTLTVTLPPGETFAASPSAPGFGCRLGAENTRLSCASTAALPIAPGVMVGTVSATVDIAEGATGTVSATAALEDPADGAAPARAVAAVTVGAAPDAPTPTTGAAGSAPGLPVGALLMAAGGLMIAWPQRHRARPGGRSRERGR